MAVIKIAFVALFTLYFFIHNCFEEHINRDVESACVSVLYMLLVIIIANRAFF